MSPERKTSSNSSRISSDRCSTGTARHSWIHRPPAYAAARLSLALGEPADHLLDEAVSTLRARSPVTERWAGGHFPAVLAPVRNRNRGECAHAELCFPGGLGASFARFKELTLSSRAAGMAPQAALAAGHGFVLYEPTMCGWYLLALEEVAAACRARGRQGEASGGGGRGRGGGRWIVASLLWWDEGRIFVAYDVSRSDTAHWHRGHGTASCCESHR